VAIGTASAPKKKSAAVAGRPRAKRPTALFPVVKVNSAFCADLGSRRRRHRRAPRYFDEEEWRSSGAATRKLQFELAAKAGANDS